MKTSILAASGRRQKIGAVILPLLAVVLAGTTEAADISWSGGTASYTNAANWIGGVVPGAGDIAINDSGTNNVVQVNSGEPDWTLTGLRAGNSTGGGAFTQNGQTVRVTGTPRGIRMGAASNTAGIYTLNGGVLSFTNGELVIGQLGTGVLNVNGGLLTGNATLAVNIGSSLDGVTATVDGGTNKTGFTWFEQGLYIPDSSRGVPAAGSTFASLADANISYTMAPSYAVNDAFLIYAGATSTSATVTLTSPTACSDLSFLGSSGNGAVTMNYTVHHADSTIETGSLVVRDWFDNAGTIAWRTGGRVPATGLDFQIINDGPNFPYLYSQNITLTNTTSAVTSVDLTYSSGGVACLLAVSSSTGGGIFTPLAITGYNQDMIIEAGAPIYVSGAVTDVLNQTAGAINTTGEVWIGNHGTGIYNLSGGSNTLQNWTAVGRNGGNGTLNMTAGTLNKTGGGNFLVAAGVGSIGLVNHSGGTITCDNEFLVPQFGDGTTLGTYNVSGTAALTVNNWFAIGRDGGPGIVNLTNGTITKSGNGGNHFDIGASGVGTLNQFGGSVVSTLSDTWMGENGSGTWTMSGGTALLSILRLGVNGAGTGLLNLNGGTMTVNEIAGGAGTSSLNLNGATIVAGGNNGNFMHDLGVAYVLSNGLVFDSQAFSVSVAQGLIDDGTVTSGGVTKNGSGTLTLAGPNSYVGATVINAGKLAVTTDSTGAGNYTVANGASLGVTVQFAGAQLNAANVTLATSTGASLDFDLGAFGNPIVAPLNVLGAVAVNGVITVNVADGFPQLGQFPLLKYVSRTGSGSFVLGSLPSGVVASIVTNGPNSSIDLNIVTVNTPRWDGQAGGNWDIGLTTNWVNVGTGLPTTYGDGNPVTFDDNAPGTPIVNLVTTVSPASVTVTNNGLNYTLTGAGKISGATGLAKQGIGVLTIVNTGGNNYTGPTVISGGTVNVTNLANGGSPSAIGAAAANPTNLVFAGGTLSYAGAPVSVNRGYTVQGTGSTIDIVSNLTLSGVVRGTSGTFNKTGSGQLTYSGVSSSNVLCDFNTSGSTYLVRGGTVVLDGSAGGQTNYSRNTNLGADTGVNPTLILTNTTLVTRSMQLGNNADCTGTLIMNSNSTMTVAANNFAVGFSTGIASAGVLTQNAGSTIDASAELWVGQGALATGTYNMNGGSATFRNWVAIGRNGGAGTFNMTGGDILRTGGGVSFMIGSRDGTTGSRGTLNHSGGTILCANEYWIGEAQNNAAAAFGTNNISGTATVIVSNWVAIGREGGVGFLNMSGGSFTKLGNSGNHFNIGDGGPAGAGTINQSGGVITSVLSDTYLGTSRDGTWNMSGGAANLSVLVFSQNSGCTNGVMNLSGGVLTATEIRAGSGSNSRLNLNGGTIAAGNGANANFLHNLSAANVFTNGATIDSGTNIINVSQALLNGDGNGGGLTKLGNGTLRLNGVNTYTGSTLVTAGTLGGTGTIAGPVSVSSGATLAPGASIGTLTISNTLTLAAGGTTFVEVSLDGGVTNNDQVAGLANVAYAGSLVVTNVGSNALTAGAVFKLFAATANSGNFSSVTILPGGSGTFNPATGELTIAPTAPPTITSVKASGGNLILIGTGGAPGGSYTWITATNVAASLPNWTTNSVGTFDGAGAFSNAIPINASDRTRFFRLQVP